MEEKAFCPLCESNSVEILAVRDWLSNDEMLFSYAKCPACTLVYLKKRPLEKDIASYYKNDYQPYRSKYNALVEKYIEWRTDQEIRHIKKFSPGAKKILELGSSWGKYILDLKERGGFDVVGVDISKEMSDIGKSHGLDIKVGTLIDQKFQDKSFDIVVGNHVIEHLYNPRETIREISRILKDEGLLILRTPNIASPEKYFFGKYWLPYEAPRHIFLFSDHTIRQLLEGAGFGVLKITHDVSPNNIILSIRNFFLAHKKNRLADFFNINNYFLLAFFYPVSLFFGLFGISGRLKVIAKKGAKSHGNSAWHIGALKALVSALLIYLIFQKIHFNDLLPIIKNASVKYFALAAVFLFVAYLLNSWKWKYLLKNLNITLSLKKVLSLNLIGYFYSMFLPGGQLTGETAKILRSFGSTNEKVHIVLSVVLDRLTGFAGFFVLAMPAMLLSDVEFVEKKTMTLILGIFTLFSLLPVIITFKNLSRFAKSLATRVLIFLPFKSLKQFFLKVIDALLEFEGKTKEYVISVLLAALFQFVNTLALYSLVWSLGLNVNILDILWIYALVSLVLFIPASIMGLGQREISFTYLLSLVGIGAAEAISLSLLLFAITLLYALLGGILELRFFLGGIRSLKVESKREDYLNTVNFQSTINSSSVSIQDKKQFLAEKDN